MMTSFSIVTVCIYFNFLTYFTVCNRDALFAFTGCHATLQWNLGNISYKQERTDIRIIDNAGDVIASKKRNQCISQNNLSVSCVISYKNDDWIIFLTLMNITTNHTGNYTAWFKEDLHVENKTTPLIVIDKPRIMELQKPVLYQSFSVICTTSYTSDCLTYYWKINGSGLQYSINLHATTSTLTFKNVTMMDNFSKLTCQAGIEKCSNILCNSSSEESDPYTVEPYSSLAPEESQGFRPEQYWMGSITVSVFLLIVDFVLLIIHWRRSASREIDNYGRSCNTGSKEGVSANRSTFVRQPPNVDRSKTCASEDHDTCTRSHDLRTSREYPGPNLQEDKYSTLDEGVLSIYDYARDNIINGNSHDTGNITEHSLYDYASPIETCRIVVAHIHVTFENYITPVHDPVGPIEGEIDVLGTDRTDITTSSELAHSISDINVHDSDHTYITPII